MECLNASFPTKSPAAIQPLEVHLVFFAFASENWRVFFNEIEQYFDKYVCPLPHQERFTEEQKIFAKEYETSY
jgi:hypothetical protein